MKSPKEMIEDIVQAGLRQQDIADNTGLAKSHVSELRSGSRESILLKSYMRLSDYHKKVMRSRARKSRKTESA